MGSGMTGSTLGTGTSTSAMGAVDSTSGAMRSGTMSGDYDYDNDWRSDYNSNYANLGGRYEDYAPAYQYGSTLASDSRYRGRAWDDFESDARSDWQTRYPGSDWERFKAAVRHGWQRMTGQR
jgi:hypothetical protein